MTQELINELSIIQGIKEREGYRWAYPDYLIHSQIVVLDVGEWHSGSNIIKLLYFRFCGESEEWVVPVVEPFLEEIVKHEDEFPSIFLIK